MTKSYNNNKLTVVSVEVGLRESVFFIAEADCYTRLPRLKGIYIRSTSSKKIGLTEVDFFKVPARLINFPKKVYGNFSNVSHSEFSSRRQ